MTTENHDELPEDVCFEADGHVTDVVLTCLADGEIAILPAAATAHVDACEACTSRLGVEALLSVNATDALLAAAGNEATAPRAVTIAIAAPVITAPARAPSSMVPSSRKRRPLPIGAIAAALCVAVLGALPGLGDSWSTLRAMLPDYLHALPIWSHAIEAVLKGMMASRSGAVLRWITAAVFIGAGTLLARATTRRRVLEGGLG